jgi:hypothetical protein
LRVLFLFRLPVLRLLDQHVGTIKNPAVLLLTLFLVYTKLIKLLGGGAGLCRANSGVVVALGQLLSYS